MGQLKWGNARKIGKIAASNVFRLFFPQNPKLLGKKPLIWRCQPFWKSNPQLTEKFLSEINFRGGGEKYVSIKKDFSIPCFSPEVKRIFLFSFAKGVPSAFKRGVKSSISAWKSWKHVFFHYIAASRHTSLCTVYLWLFSKWVKCIKMIICTDWLMKSPHFFKNLSPRILN